MEIAESLRVEPRRLAAALPMVDRGQLERRLLMILDANRSVGRGRAAPAIGLRRAGRDRGSRSRPPLRLQVVAKAPKPVTAPIVAASTAAAPLHRRKERLSRYGTFQESDDDGGMSSFALQRSLGDGGDSARTVARPVRFDAKDGAIRELGPGSSVEVETRTGAALAAA
jgi:hypothetical protein